MAAAHRGDKRLYERLLRETAVAIDRYIRRRFRALSFVDDCVQESLLAVHNARHTYNPERPFRPWRKLWRPRQIASRMQMPKTSWRG
jgi:RNA polymerase sigma-70 factor (ECF subfamily)